MPARFFASFIAVILLSLIATVAYAQDANPLDRPIDKPIYIDKPDLSSTELQGKSPLWIYLSYNYDKCRAYYGDDYYRGCSRRLGLEGRKAETGITLKEPLAGEWRWASDYALSFTPSVPWKSDQSYSLTLDLDAMDVPENVVFGTSDRSTTLLFSTQPLKVTFPTVKYMQDPDKPEKKLVSAQLSFNYPVKDFEVKNRISLWMEEELGGKLKAGPKGLDYEFKLNSDQTSGWIAVPIKTLPDQDRYLRLEIAAGLPPSFDGTPTDTAFSERARVPSLSTYLSVPQSSAVIARSEDGTPRQLLSYELNSKASPADALKATKLYLLPTRHPVTGRSGKADDGSIFEWKATNQVSAEILKLSQPLELKAAGTDTADTTQFGYNFSAPSGRYLYMEIEPGMKAFGGYTLGRAYSTILKVPEWPNDLQIMQQGSILSLSGARKLSLHARGTDKLSVGVAHIRTEALQHFISQTEGDIRTPSFRNWTFQREDIAKIDSRDLPMNYQAPQLSQYAAFDFSSYLSDDRKGLFLLNIQGYKDSKAVGTPQQRFVLVTDLGLLLKEGAKSRDVFLVSFASGKPVKGAQISVLGRNGLSVFEGKSDGDGHVALPDLSGFKADREPVAVVARSGDDFAFIPYSRADRYLNYSKFETGGAVTPSDGMNAFVFSDRGIYRPGEEARFGLVVRNADWAPLPPDLPLQLIVRDPRGRVVKDTILKFPADGMAEALLQTGEAWPTGTYTAALHIPSESRNGNLLGSATIRVEDFQPDRLRIKTVFSGENIDAIRSGGWVAPSGLDASVTLTNLYGTPASERRISAAVTLNPAILSFPAYKDYTFYDSYPATPRSVEYDLPDAKTDMQGKALLPLQLEQQEQATYSLNVETRGYEAGSGRGVTAYSTLMVSPMESVVGYKTDANLSYLKAGQSYSAQLLALNPTLEPVELKDLTLELYRITHVSTLVKRDDGSYAYESTPRESLVDSKPFSIAETGTAFSLSSAQPGNFSYRLKSAAGLKISDIGFRVVGEGEQEGLDREAVLDVKINKTSFGPGDEIEIAMTSPYTGAGLITLESDQVIASKWFRSDKTDSVQKIKIPETFSGKGYVNVAFIRSLNSKEIYLSPLSYAVVPFIANTQARTASIELKAPSTIKPGVPVTLSYKSDRPGKAVIYAVDEGILQIARYKTPDPIDFFLINRALQVRTAQMLDLLMPEFDLVRELSAKGGDAVAEAAALGKHLNPFKRKTLAPAVYWSGIVEADDTERSLTFTPPGHFNGEMRIIAIMVNDAAVNSAERLMTVRGDLVLTPNLPLAMAPGDSAEASLTVANNLTGSGEAAKISLSAKTEGGLKAEGLPADIVIPEGTEKTLTYKVSATEDLGPASVILSASLNAVAQSAEATSSIRPAVARATTLLTGYSKDGTATLKPDRDLYVAESQRQLNLSPLPTAYMYGLKRYLDEYAYGCTEQLVSKVLPQLSLYGQPELAQAESDALGERVAVTIDMLSQRQSDDGGISLWDGGGEADGFASIYALDFLVRARALNFPVPGALVEDNLRYLRAWINRSVQSDADARLKAYGVYIMTSSGIVTTNEILHLLKYFEDNKSTAWKTDTTGLYLAASYKLMQQTELAADTLKSFQSGLDADKAAYSLKKYPKRRAADADPLIKYAQYVSILSAHFPEEMSKLDPEIVFTIARFVDEQYYSTISAAYAIAALQDYNRASGAIMSAAPPSVKVDGTALTLGGDSLLQADLQPEAKAIAITGTGQPLFYTLSESGFDKAASTKPLADHLEISRSYVDASGKDISAPVALGDVITARIKIRAHEHAVENVAIVDLLPGGFELDTDSVGADSSLTPVFIDKREDRVIAFSTIRTDEQVFLYKLRATSKGTFVTPAPYAEAMYDLTTKARGTSGALEVIDPR